MKLLDKTILKKYVDKDQDKYLSVRNFSVLLISLWVLVAVLLLLSGSHPGITLQVLYMFIIINISLILVNFNKVNIAIPILLISLSIIIALPLFTGNSPPFGIYEVYKLAFLQLILLIIAAMFTYHEIYVYLVMIIGIISIIFQFFLRGLKFNKTDILLSFENYIITIFLLLFSAIIIGKILCQKKKSLAEIKENENKFSKAFKTSSDSLSITNVATGEIIEWNRAFENIFGYSKVELLHTSIIELGIWKELEDRKKMVEILKKYGSIRNFKAVGIRKSGEYFFGDISAEIIQINNEKFILSTVRDISKDKEAEDALKNSERNYREIFDSTNDTIFIFNAETGIVLDVNKSVFKMFGYKKEEVIGLKIDALSLKTSLSHKMTIENIKMFIEIGTKIIERQKKRKNGELFWAEITLKLSEINEEKIILTVVRDISERKKLQETLVQSEKMLSLGGLAAGMAHEINNPLAGIMQNAQVISNRLEKDTPANLKAAKELGLDLTAMRTFLKERKITSQLSRIHEAGARAAEIVANMLNFARKESSSSSHNISTLLDKTVDMAGNDYNLKKSFDFRDINVVREYEDNLPLVVCDPGQIQQVFFNILKNGAEAMNAHSTLQQAQYGVSLETEHDILEKAQFTLVARQKGNMIRVEIKNNLCGILPEVQGRIFEPFYTTKPVGTGTGLGLSVSYFIINETHNGELRVESNGESWVKFIIELPLEPRE